MKAYTAEIRLPDNAAAQQFYREILRAALKAQGLAYSEAVLNGDVQSCNRIMENIFELSTELSKLVPRAGVEPALREETDFESAASTSSANGATLADYCMNDVKVKALGDDPEWEDAVAEETSKVYQSIPQILPHSTRCTEDNFPLRVANLLKLIDLPNGWKGKAGYYTNSDRLYLQVIDPNGKCNVTGAPEPWKGRKWALSPFMTDGEIINTAWKAVMTAAEHELREGFKFKGVAIFDPHYDPHALADFMKSKGSRTWRADGMTEVA